MKAAVLWEGAEKSGAYKSFSTSIFPVNTEAMSSAFDGDGQLEEITMLISHFEGELNKEVLEKDLKVRKRPDPLQRHKTSSTYLYQ